MRLLIVFCCALGAAAACSRPAPDTKASTAAPVPPPAALGGGHIVEGTVPPAANGVSTIVVLDPDPPRELPPSETAFLDQVNRVFTPDILFARVGEPVEFRNNDDTLHNVNVTDEATKTQLFNVAIIPETVYKFTFTHEGLYDAHCDIHQTMASVIVASASPYAKLADADGRVEFDDVVPGGYVATAYVGASKVEQKIDVSGPRTEIALGK